MGIFCYPTQLNAEQVVGHAQGWGGQFGQILHCCAKWGSDQRPYAIINFDGPGPAKAAVGHQSRPDYEGWYLKVLPWRVAS